MSSRKWAFDKMKGWLASGEWSVGSRVMPERELSEKLGVSRGALRQALADIEAEGYIWRQVGKGTFVGARPAAPLADLDYIASRSSPSEIAAVRLVIEPGAAFMAAKNANAVDLGELRHCLERIREAKTFQEFAFWDGRLHLAVGKATRNGLLAYMLEILHSVRHLALWNPLPKKEAPWKGQPSLIEHQKIVEAIEQRDAEGAEREMRAHLLRVNIELLKQW